MPPTIHHLLIALLAGLLLAGCNSEPAGVAAPAAAPVVARDPHAGHDHGPEGPKKEEIEDLFADAKAPSHDDHAGHDDHDDHAGEKADSHDDHAGEAIAGKDDHAGHDHGAGPGAGNCPEHGIPEAEDALCQPQLMATLRPGQGLKVRLATPDGAAKIGVVASTPQPAGEAGTPLPGQVVFNRNRLARLTPQLSGVVKKIHVTLGQQVKAGQLLAELAAPEVAALRASLATAQSRLQLAEANYLREQELLAKGVSSRLEFEQAEAERRQAQSAVTQSRQQLQDHGVDAATLKGLSGSTLALRAPFAGTVTEIASIAGEAVGPESSLLTLADLDTLWVELSVPEDRLLDLQPGAGVQLAFASLPGRAFNGKVFWVAPALDEKTRMLKALAEIDNSAGLLKSGLFGEARLAGKSSATALSVPADALQTIDGQPYLFIELEKDLFELRRVETAGRQRGAVLISLGLTPADRVVTAQGFALKSELLKSRLGASCADH